MGFREVSAPAVGDRGYENLGRSPVDPDLNVLRVGGETFYRSRSEGRWYVAESVAIRELSDAEKDENTADNTCPICHEYESECLCEEG